jgi:uncharacterized membrane protein
MSLTTRDAFEVRPDETGRRHLRVALTPRDVAGIVVALQLILLATVVLGLSGQPFVLLRAAIGVGTLAFLTGALFLGVLGVSPGSRSSFVAYAVGASAALGMGYGVVVNFGLEALGVLPITPVPMTFAFAAFVCGLAGLYAREREESLTYSLDLDELWSPLWLGLALIPFLGIYGGLALTAYDSNTILLVLYAAIVGVVALVLTDRIPARALPVVVWLVAIALLLQNTLSGNYLAWGDQPKEAGLAMIVLQNGFWTPNTPAPYGNKFGMLRIVILHPIYRVVTGLDLVWIFKLVHPLIFSFAPVALLQAYRNHVDDETAFLSVFLYVSLFSFFVVLSRNSRTATALLFLAVLAMLVGDRTLNGRHRKILAIVFALSVVVCHYGVSYIVLAVLPGVVVLTKIFDYVYGDQTTLRTSPTFVALYGVGTFAWYSYLVPSGKATGTLFGFLREFVRRVQTEFLSPEASATTRIVANDWGSSTLRVLKFYNVAIGGVIGLGIVAVLLRRVPRVCRLLPRYLHAHLPPRRAVQHRPDVPDGATLFRAVLRDRRPRRVGDCRGRGRPTPCLAGDAPPRGSGRPGRVLPAQHGFRLGDGDPRVLDERHARERAHNDRRTVGRGRVLLQAVSDGVRVPEFGVAPDSRARPRDRVSGRVAGRDGDGVWLRAAVARRGSCRGRPSRYPRRRADPRGVRLPLAV